MIEDLYWAASMTRWRKCRFLFVLSAAGSFSALSGCSDSTATLSDGNVQVEAATDASVTEDSIEADAARLRKEIGVTLMWEMSPEGLRRARLPWNKAAALSAEEISVRSLPKMTNSIGMEFIELPPGEFQMGSPDDDLWAMPDEKPSHTAAIELPFFMSVYEVTRGQFAKFVDETNYLTYAEKSGEGGFYYDAETQRLVPNKNSSWRNTGFEQDDNHPVVNVNWDDANAFCTWLTNKEGMIYRLPSEKEWEYACRGGTTTFWYTGSTEEATIGAGNVCDQQLEALYPFASWSMHWDDGHPFTAPVGSYPPNPFGIYDMIGNVFEWCEDPWTATNYDGVPVPDPAEPDISESRVVRGGSFLSLIFFTRSADRVALKQKNRAAITGFRIVRDFTPDEISRSK